ncbi:MAG: hypothetical protein IT305_18910 [Chloroflexi bacterium]|nr:hypothetical protein [Chloroflexota bacterium]
MIVSRTGRPGRWMSLLLWLRFVLPELAFPFCLFVVVAAFGLVLAGSYYRSQAAAGPPVPSWVPAVVGVLAGLWVVRQRDRWR